MKAGVVHCRCSKCFSVPSKRRIRKRVSALTLLSLPDEVLLCVLQCLSAEDLLSVRAVHSRLRDIIDSHSSVWARVSFKDSWPAPDSIWLFERAAEKGNFEAAVKLGIAYLYNEGPSLSDEGRAEVCGRKAAWFFGLAESLRSAAAGPFVWLFIRPPWSPSGSCCKAVVYDWLKTECNAHTKKRGSLLHCLARILQLFDAEEKRSEALSMLAESSNHGCLQSSYLLWEHQRTMAVSDPGRYLQCLRALRDYAAKGCWEAQLALAKLCSSGNPLGLEPRACADLVTQLFRTSSPPHRRAQDLLRRGINDTMRYILVDWLVEVTTMKDFSSLALHVTVSCVDRYLALHSVPKSRLQLLGIACMVVCTRYISKDILTIREAVWLTDNTYKYEDLVRMMGEVISVLEGRIRTPTVLDYGEVLLSLLPVERRSAHLYSYVCELSLLYTSLTLLTPAQLASAALLLTRALHHHAPVWPAQLAENTGFSREDLVPHALQLYVKCFNDDVPRDYRQVSLTGVKQRFEDEAYQQISKEKVMELGELCQVLEVSEWEQQVFGPEAPCLAPQAAEIHTFLSSPAGNSKRRREDGMESHRGSFLATPTAELSNQEETLLGDILDWSLDTSCSGYEGDQESEGEREGEAAATPMIHLELACRPEDGLQHCRALSSDDDSFCDPNEDEEEEEEGGSCSWSSGRGGRAWSARTQADLHSSGYSSVQSTSPPPTLASRAPPPRRQVKRKNGAEHSGEEAKEEEEEDDAANTGFLVL
ncbi:cyclin-F [Megalops cyprinoides]|uniref:cyclin-F n=1 Tax=Megalops cyprinoides TaxID=118141 RepID=UPI0018653F86|nr:cyclin-F [Megalops cyprinoides]